MSLRLRNFAGGKNLTKRDGLVSYINDLLEEATNPHPVELSCIDGRTVQATEKPGGPDEAAMILQDGNRRVFSGTVNFDPTVVGAGGMEVGGSTLDTMLFLYAVPDSVAMKRLTVYGSFNDPLIGPELETNYRYLGAVYRNAKGELSRFSQSGTEFALHSAAKVEILNDTMMSGRLEPAAILLPQIPKTAACAILLAIVESDNQGGGRVGFYVDGSEYKGEKYFIQSKQASDQSPLTFEMPIIDPEDPKIWRRISGFESCGTSKYQLYLNGWCDRYA